MMTLLPLNIQKVSCLLAFHKTLMSHVKQVLQSFYKRHYFGSLKF